MEIMSQAVVKCEPVKSCYVTGNPISPHNFGTAGIKRAAELLKRRISVLQILNSAGMLNYRRHSKIAYGALHICISAARQELFERTPRRKSHNLHIKRWGQREDCVPSSPKAHFSYVAQTGFRRGDSTAFVLIEYS